MHAEVFKTSESIAPKWIYILIHFSHYLIEGPCCGYIFTELNMGIPWNCSTFHPTHISLPPARLSERILLSKSWANCQGCFLVSLSHFTFCSLVMWISAKILTISESLQAFVHLDLKILSSYLINLKHREIKFGERERDTRTEISIRISHVGSKDLSTWAIL